MSSEINSDVPTMPAPIAAGIVKVMASIKRLAKDHQNAYARYNYASIDDFLEAVGPLCAEAGIFVLCDEESLEVSESQKPTNDGGEKVTHFLTVRWLIHVGHTSGVLYGPFHRTVTVPATGAQAYGSAQSYTLKQFMRGLFCIPTGDDEDADNMPKTELPPKQAPAKGKGADEPMCPIHHVPFFKKGKMKSFAHKYTENGKEKWCNMPERDETDLQMFGTPPAPAASPAPQTAPPAKKWAERDEQNQQLLKAAIFSRVAELKDTPEKFRDAFKAFVALDPPAPVALELISAAGLVYTDDETKNLLHQYLVTHC